MKVYIFTRVTILNVLWIVLACFIHDNADAQTQVLTKENGGASWQSAVGGGANVRAKRISNQTISSGATTTVIFPSEDYDVNNTINHSTGVFTPPQAGYYVIKASVNWSSTNTTTAVRSIRLVKNGTTIVEQADEEGSGSMHSSIHTTIYSDGTDNYRIQVNQSSGSNHVISGTIAPGGGTAFTAFNLLPFNQEILKKDGGRLTWETRTPTNIRAVRTSQMAIASGTATDVTYTSEDFDLNNDFNPTTGVFTPPQAGYYVILASVDWGNSPNNGTRTIRLWRNGSVVTEQSSEWGKGAMSASIHTVIYSDGTDNYRVGVSQSSGASQDIIRASFSAFRINHLHDVVTQSEGGVSIDGNGTPTRIKAKRTSDMSIPSGTNTTITYLSEDFDVNGEFNHATGVFTPTQAGYYAIMATANWDAFNSTSGTRGIRLVKRIGVASTVLQKANYELGSGIMTSSLHTVVYYDGTSGHTYYVEATQDSGSSHDIGGTSVTPGCIFTVYKL